MERVERSGTSGTSHEGVVESGEEGENGRKEGDKVETSGLYTGSISVLKVVNGVSMMIGFLRSGIWVVPRVDSPLSLSWRVE